jgi:hypothetical protein
MTQEKILEAIFHIRSSAESGTYTSLQPGQIFTADQIGRSAFQIPGIIFVSIPFNLRKFELPVSSEYVSIVGVSEKAAISDALMRKYKSTE